MKAKVNFNGELLTADLSRPLDISIPTNTENSSTAWFVSKMKISPVINDRFIGSVKDGGDVNFRNILFNPHGNSTHTESVGHISSEVHSVHNVLEKHHFIAQVITIEPITLETDLSQWEKKGDFQISIAEIKGKIKEGMEALIIRTSPNGELKKTQDHNNTNWPYLSKEATEHIRKKGIKHLLIDLPSVDREQDGGHLIAHRAFWNYPQQIDLKRTITELVYVANTINDDVYLLNLSLANIVNDASPSRPILYKLLK
jgi:kynurenine formamidase